MRWSLPQPPCSPSQPLCSTCPAAGIELGYQGCRYGFSHAKDPSVKLQPHWPGEEQDGRHYGSIIALLYDTTTWRPVAWGRLAQKQ
jgi:hypothetical protein